MVSNNEKTIKGISTDGTNSLMINSKYWGDYSTSDLATINKKSILSGVDIELVKPEELQEVKDYVSESSQVIAKALIDLDGRIKNFDNIPLDYLVNVSYSNLVEMRNNGVLTPGQQYRITDYVTTTSDKNTISAGHRFDIIVTANSENSLYDIARAYYNEDDSYFVDNLAKLEAWQIWYSLDNDTNRFAWADSTNGKGVIYRMIDEWDNDCPYDFKNIMFSRKVYDDHTGVLGYKEESDGDDVFCYTFSWMNSDEDILDGTIVMNLDKEYSFKGVYNNKIKPCNYNINTNKTNKRFLNNNVFFNSSFSEFDLNGTYYFGCFSNIFGYNCVSNTFNNFCCLNSFGDECSNNSFGDVCSYNVFKEGCSENVLCYNSCSNSFGECCYLNYIGKSCSDNTFGYNCYEIEIGEECLKNIFGYHCYEITLSNFCSNNTFGADSRFIELGEVCCANTFGKYCNNIKFIIEKENTNTESGTIISYMCYTHIGDNVYNTTIRVNKTDNKYTLGKNGNKLKNIYISNDFSSDHMTVSLNDYEIVSKSYTTTITKDSEGNIKKFCLADLVP